MSGFDPQAKMLCAVCSQPFYDPEQGSAREYRYTMRYVSDDHRVMFHSGNEHDLNYDPDYYAAFARIEARRGQYSERQYSELRANRERLHRDPNEPS